jgi:hypothetical protein
MKLVFLYLIDQCTTRYTQRLRCSRLIPAQGFQSALNEYRLELCYGIF